VLIRAYADVAGPRPIYRRTESCACGGTISIADGDDMDAAGLAVSLHQRTSGHQLWWARARAAGWGPGTR
jgi:hypothetical protein